MQVISQHKCFGGIVTYYSHISSETQCEMRFSAFMPPASVKTRVPVLTYLSGLTCTEENFTVKAGAYRKASELGIAIIAPDTSPRGDGVPTGDGIGFGAGFYVDATQAPWNKNYRMYSYITKELYLLIGTNFPVDNHRHGIFGHSMGGHGALTLYLKNPDQYKSVSALAPVCSPINAPFGQRAFAAYLGDNMPLWESYDATKLLIALGDGSHRSEILVDQGLEDHPLSRLNPDLLKKACAQVNQKLNLREHAGYDHGYFFVQSFIDDHLSHHARLLSASFS